MVAVAAHTSDVEEMQEVIFVGVRRIKTVRPERDVEVGQLRLDGEVVDDVVGLLIGGRDIGDGHEPDLRSPNFRDGVERAGIGGIACANERTEDAARGVLAENFVGGEKAGPDVVAGGEVTVAAIIVHEAVRPAIIENHGGRAAGNLSFEADVADEIRRHHGGREPGSEHVGRGGQRRAAEEHLDCDPCDEDSCTRIRFHTNAA